MGKKETFGERLARLRNEAGLSQPQLAKKARMALGSLRQWEQDRRIPLATACADLCRALGISAGLLLDEPFAIKKATTKPVKRATRKLPPPPVEPAE